MYPPSDPHSLLGISLKKTTRSWCQASPAGVLTAAFLQQSTGNHAQQQRSGLIHCDQEWGSVALSKPGTEDRVTWEDAPRGIGKRHDRSQYCWYLWAVGFQVSFTRSIRQKCSLRQLRVEPQRTRKYANDCRKVGLLHPSAGHATAGRPLPDPRSQSRPAFCRRAAPVETRLLLRGQTSNLHAQGKRFGLVFSQKFYLLPPTRVAEIKRKENNNFC